MTGDCVSPMSDLCLPSWLGMTPGTTGHTPSVVRRDKQDGRAGMNHKKLIGALVAILLLAVAALAVHREASFRTAAAASRPIGARRRRRL